MAPSRVRDPPVRGWKERSIQRQRPFSRATRQRFQKLLKLASDSPYPGERENACAAASRLAQSHGMSLIEAARDEVEPEPPSDSWPESATDVDNGVGPRRPRRTYWDEGYGEHDSRSKAEWLGNYAKARQEVRRELEAQDRAQAMWLAFLIFLIFAVVGGVAFVVGGVADFFRLVLTGS